MVTSHIEFLSWKWWRCPFEMGELIKHPSIFLSSPFSFWPRSFKFLPYGLVGFHPKSQGLVGSFVIFNHFLFGDLAFHGSFPSEPPLGSLIYWAGLISRISSLAPLYRVVCTLFSRPFLFFLSLLGCGPILLSSPASFVRAFPWAMSLSYPCKAHGLFP